MVGVLFPKPKPIPTNAPAPKPPGLTDPLSRAPADDERVAALYRDGLAPVRRDDDLALDHVNEFGRRIGGAIGAGCRAPPSGDR